MSKWGVVMYWPGSSFPKNDYASFDGWYAHRQLAQAIYAEWCEAHPQMIVSIVRAEEIRFPS
jgi:hypothetical protein